MKKKPVAKKAAKKITVKARGRNSLKKIEDLSGKASDEVFCVVDSEAPMKVPTPEQEAYERGKRHALSDNKLVSYSAQISAVKNNLRAAIEEQERDEDTVAHVRARMLERSASIEHMENKIERLKETFNEAVRDAQR